MIKAPRCVGVLSGCRKTSIVIKNGGWGVAPRRVAGTPVPVFTPFPGERGQFGMDAEIRTHQALHEAKPSECPKGDRDNKLEVCFKTILFLQTEALRCVGVLLLCMFTAYCNSQDLSCHISLPQFRWKLLLRLFLQSCRPYKDTAFRRKNRLYASYRISSLYYPYQARSNG